MRLGRFSALFLATGLAAAASSGCGSNLTVTLNELHNHTLANSNRTYKYWLPPSYETNMETPVIFSFHVIHENPDQEETLDMLDDTFFNTGQIVVYPQAIESGGEVIWDGPPGVHNGDIDFVLAIIEELEERFCVDERRIYATGKSEGGGFVGTLACNETSSNVFAAFAPVSGAFYQDEDCSDPSTVMITCNPGRSNVPIIEFHGGADELVNITGGERRDACLPSITHYMGNWAQLDGFSGNVTSSYNLTSAAKFFLYGEGDGIDLARVTFVFDGDNIMHDWPFTIETVDTEMDGGPVATFNATSVIIEFFLNYTLPSDL